MANIWIIDMNPNCWAADTELSLKNAHHNITRFDTAHEVYSELDMLRYNNNNDSRPDLIIAFSQKSSVPYQEELFNRAEAPSVPVMMQDYRSGDYMIHTKVHGKIKRFNVPETTLSELPDLVDKVVAEARSKSTLTR